MGSQDLPHAMYFQVEVVLAVATGVEAVLAGVVLGALVVVGVDFHSLGRYFDFLDVVNLAVQASVVGIVVVVVVVVVVVGIVVVVVVVGIYVVVGIDVVVVGMDVAVVVVVAVVVMTVGVAVLVAVVHLAVEDVVVVDVDTDVAVSGLGQLAVRNT